MGILRNIINKLNPTQRRIAEDSAGDGASNTTIRYDKAFKEIEVVNRGCHIVIQACAGLDYDVMQKLPFSPVAKRIDQKKIHTLLNYRPNPFQSVQEFRTHIFSDFIFNGNIFMYWDGSYLYHWPAKNVKVIPDPKTFVNRYEYLEQSFLPEEVIHIKDVSERSIYRGTSRLDSTRNTLNARAQMDNFRKKFFEGGAVPGFVVATDNTLSKSAKQRTIDAWVEEYNPARGTKRPMILDSGLKPVSIGTGDFKEMDFENTISRGSEELLMALGVPKVLLFGGNNANISPNLRLFYLETVLPIVKLYVSAVERFFGYDIEAITETVSALQPELRDMASFLSSLTNGGIITPNEAREQLRFEAIEGLDEIRIPVNVAGSAAQPDEGGRPNEEGSEGSED